MGWQRKVELGRFYHLCEWGGLDSFNHVVALAVSVTPSSVTEAVTVTLAPLAVVVAWPDELVVEVVGDTVPPVAVQVTVALGITVEALSSTVAVTT